MIRVQRIYDNPRGNNNNGNDFRLWPRGLSKDKVKVDLWEKDIAPSNLLRKWFNHDEKKWNEFKRRYFKELDRNSELVNVILKKEQQQKPSSATITLLYSAKNEKFNNAAALKQYLEEKIKEY